MKLLRGLVFSVVILGITFVAIRTMTPGYPEINRNAQISEVKSFIKKVLKSNAWGIATQNIDSPAHGASVEHIKAATLMFKNLGKCGENKECLINEYNTFMSDWASDSIRRETRAYFMLKKFGLIGEQINESLGFMY